MENTQDDVSVSQTQEIEDLALAALRGANLLTPYISAIWATLCYSGPGRVYRIFFSKFPYYT